MYEHKCCSNFSLTLSRWSSSTGQVEWCLPQGLEVVAATHWSTWLVVQHAGDGQGRLYFMYTPGVKFIWCFVSNILFHFCSYWPCLGETMCLRLPLNIEISKCIWRRQLYWIGVCVLWRLYNVSFQINLYFKCSSCSRDKRLALQCHTTDLEGAQLLPGIFSYFLICRK